MSKSSHSLKKEVETHKTQLHQCYGFPMITPVEDEERFERPILVTILDGQVFASDPFSKNKKKIKCDVFLHNNANGVSVWN